MLQQNERWIWPFELTEKIGEGGMGVVYKARYVVNDRFVAVKLIPSDVSDPTILARFERELEILKTLRHPNIVLCFGGSCENKRRFYAMELVEGGTLDDLLRKRGRLPWELVVEYAKQMCAALGYAHGQGILHRDLKPANFLVTGEGRLKLSDFGLATLMAGRKITAAGRTAGTYEYMSPEQITGKEMTPRADLYSLGCVLFELLTGRAPFDGANSAQILHHHLKTRAPRVGVDAPDCPAALDRLIARLLEKNPEERPASAAEVAETLDVLAEPLRIEGGAPVAGITSRPTTPKPRAEPVLPAEPRPVTPKPASTMTLPVLFPPWLPLVALGLIGVLLTLLSASWERNSRLSEAQALWITAFSESEEYVVRQRAAVSLGKLGQSSPEALAPLIKALDDPNPATRAVAAKGMANSGNPGRAHITTLMRMSKHDDDLNVRSAARDATERIKESAPVRSIWPWILFLTVIADGVLAFLLWRWGQFSR